jgi:hypothetical protein
MLKKYLAIVGLFILINGSSYGTVTFIMKNYTANPGTQITIPIKVKDFLNVVSIQGTVKFDSTKLSLVSIQDYGLPGMVSTDFNTFQPGTGRFTFSWMSGSPSGTSLADSTTVFSMKLNVIGSSGQSSLLSFVNIPTIFEVVDPTMQPIAYSLVNGSLTIVTPTSIDEFSTLSKSLQIYPNPAVDQVNIVFGTLLSGKVHVELYDASGSLIFSDEFMTDAFSKFLKLKLKSKAGTVLPAGFYFIKMHDDYQNFEGKFIINKTNDL